MKLKLITRFLHYSLSLSLPLRLFVIDSSYFDERHACKLSHDCSLLLIIVDKFFASKQGCTLSARYNHMQSQFTQF